MPDFSYYQTYLQSGLKEAERYLLSDDLFWTLSVIPTVEESYPNLTLGGLLLHQKYAQALARTNSQQISIQKLETQLQALRTRWRVAWGRKAAWEFESRLRQWGNVIKEIRNDPDENVAYYRYEVRWRLVLNLLRAEVDQVESAFLEHLESLDLVLRALFKPGDFIWEPALAPAFPKNDYWYLWGYPREARL